MILLGVSWGPETEISHEVIHLSYIMEPQDYLDSEAGELGSCLTCPYSCILSHVKTPRKHKEGTARARVWFPQLCRAVLPLAGAHVSMDGTRGNSFPGVP